MRTLIVLLLLSSVARADVATEIPNLTARVAYARAADGVLHVGIAFHNPTDRKITASQALRYGDMFIVDRVAKQKLSPLHDSNGIALAGPLGDLNDGGRWFPVVEPGADVVAWVMFPALPAGRHFDLHVPLVPSFDDLALDGSLPAKTVPCAVAPLTATVVSQSRADGWLTVELAIENASAHRAGPSAAIQYGEAFLFDPIRKKRYAIVSDSDGMWLAWPLSDKNEHGRWFARLDGGKRVAMKLVFEAPPDAQRVELVLPWFQPIESLALTGSGGTHDRGTPVTSEARTF